MQRSPITHPSRVVQHQWLQWMFYVIGAFGYAVLYAALISMHIYRYDPGNPNPYGWAVLAPSAWVGVAALIGRLFNPIASLVVGYHSDHTRSSWGRRRPFMAAALLPLLVGFFLVFTPPLPTASLWNALYLTLTLVLFFLAFASYMTPYLSLIAEIAQTNEQRVHLSTFTAIANLLGNAVGLVAAPWLAARFGFVSMALGLGTIAFICLLAPLAVQENFELTPPKRVNFRSALKTVVQNPTFQPFIISQILMWLTINIIYLCGNYLVVALLHQDLSFAAIANGAILLGAIVGVAPTSAIVKRLGKKATLKFSLIWLGGQLLVLGVWVVWMREMPWLCLLLFGLFGTALSGLFILPNAMLADVIDQDAHQTGMQRGAIYFGIQAMVIALSSGFAALLTGAVLMLGKTSVHPLGVQVIYPIAAIFAFSAARILSAYPIYK